VSDDWKRMHTLPRVAETRSTNNDESVFYVAVHGVEFSLRLTPDDAEALGHRLLATARNTRATTERVAHASMPPLRSVPCDRR
jgi:hypothetical protein